MALGLWLKRTMDQEIKQDNIEKEITTEKEKDGVRNLHKKYKDMIGWLEIKGTGFSYPVMQTGIKGHHEGDWQYYLHRDVHGDYSFYGTPFLDVRCKTDSDNLIIYGHNINGRRYFGYLQNFRQETFFKEHPVFSFTPVEGKKQDYHIVSVLETYKYADYYSFTDYGNEKDYYGMVEKILSHSKFQSEAAKKMKREMNESSAEAFFRKYKFVTLKYYEVVYILFHTGMRISEFCGLTLKDIDLENRTVNIDHQLQRTSDMRYIIETTKTDAGT